MKTAKGKKRILGRALATELTLEELEKVAGSMAVATTSCSRSVLGDDADDCDERPSY